MTSSFVPTVLALMTFWLCSGQCQDIPLTDLPFFEKLDDNYELRWNFNSTHIVFEAHVRTNGYIGLGISETGNMYPSDVIIGWIKGDNVYFKDRHATALALPPVDESQDWFLLDATEMGDNTTLTMIRQLETCDSEDMPIKAGNIHIIYSYHPDDPESEDAIVYHGPQRRGTKSVNLLEPSSKHRNQDALPSDAFHIDFLNANYSVPNRDTIYSCTTWKLPDLDGKHHMIRFEPVIQEGHELLVHHMILYYCFVPVDDAKVGLQYECYSSNVPEPFEQCTQVSVAWAIGGGAVDFPAHVGQPLGTPQDPVYYVLETHYDNPALRNDFVDSSGLRIILTKQLRQYDSGVLETGIEVSAYPMIPPYNQHFLAQGHCHQDCLAEAMADQQELHVFGVLQHSHLMGRKMRTRLIRNGTELPPLLVNNNYDFNFQAYTMLHEERIIDKGDAVIIDCVYDSSQRTSLSFGGLSTRDEMCLSYLLYYPRIQLAICWSRPYHFLPPLMRPADFYGFIMTQNWHDKATQGAHIKDIENRPIENSCISNTLRFAFTGTVTPRIDIRNPYVPPQKCPK